MTRKSKTKKATTDDAKRARRKFTPWDADRVTPESLSSLEVLMAWLTTPGNADRWRQDKTNTSREICQALQANGISYRELGDVKYKIRYMYNQFMSATKQLCEKNAMETFQRGEAHPKVIEEVLKMCPQYQELLPYFGKNTVTRETQVTAKNTANGVATDKSNGTDGAIPTYMRVAGEWKKNLEKDIHKTVTEEKRPVHVENVVEKSGGNGSASIVQKVKKAGNNTEQNKAKENATVVEQRLLDATKDAANRVAVAEDKTVDVGEEDKIKDVGQHQASGADNAHSVGGDESIPADDGNGQSDDDREKQSSDDEEEVITIVEQEKARADAESEDESSEEEVKPRSRVGVRSPFKTVPKESESEESSSEDDDSDEEKSDSESEQEEDDDGDERIPLAQPDEVDAATPTEAEKEEHDEVDEVTNEQVDVDENREKTEESEETVEESEGEPEKNSSKAVVDSSEDSDSNSSESESEDVEKDEEVPPTQVKTPSDQEEESEVESKNEADDDDNDIEEDTQKPVEQSDPDIEMAAEQSASDAESESPATQRPTRKRSGSNGSSSPTTKRARRGSNSNDATRDLEREAFIERAKQERDQRDELFKLERAKLECELQAKQVQLAMERSLARKKLLGAGIDPNEVNRVLPL